MNKGAYARGTLPGIGELFAAVEQNRVMKAITIIQPWATLIALGEKRLETRSWPTRHRGPLAIHAGKKVDRDAYMREEIYTTLQKHGIMFIDDMPTGAVVATCNLSDCYSIHRDILGGVVHLHGAARNIHWGYPWIHEYYFGDYSNGRYAWELTEVKQLPAPIPAKGMQGLWNWKPQGLGGKES